MSPFAATFEPPYYAVIFTSRRTPGDDEGYGSTAGRMLELASQIPGYLGIESAREGDGFGITVSYWSSEVAIAAWKAQLDHRAAQARGKARWYEHYQLRVAKVERAYSGPRATGD
jgi:heme-degrading monooxygenase HmoA